MEYGVTDATLDAQTPPPSLQFISELLSFSALREWLKVLLFGSCMEILRRLFFGVWNHLERSVWMNIAIDNKDSASTWVLFWLSRQPSWRKARSVELTTRTYGLDSHGPALPGTLNDDERDTKKPITCIPSMSAHHSMWYKHRYMVVSRSQVSMGESGMKETLHISFLSRDNSIMEEFIRDCRHFYKSAEENMIAMYMSDSYDEWKQLTTRAKRPLESIILDPGLLELLLDDARDFLNSYDWYVRRGIPYRRGYLLYGPPGSGKTSIIQSIAGELRLDIYILVLSRSGLDDNGLSELMSDLPERCIVLLEDIDAAFHYGITRSPQAGDQTEGGAGEKQSIDEASSKITLSGLLNALDGVCAQEGRILFATTNDYAALDTALCRPGRMDVHIEFKLASKYQAKRIFERFYTPVNSTLAVNYTDEKQDDEEADPDLASQFANAIPEREVSMAALQGYLMKYKARPYEAVTDAPMWVEQERAQSEARKELLAEKRAAARRSARE